MLTIDSADPDGQKPPYDYVPTFTVYQISFKTNKSKKTTLFCFCINRQTTDHYGKLLLRMSLKQNGPVHHLSDMMKHLFLCFHIKTLHSCLLTVYTI